MYFIKMQNIQKDTCCAPKVQRSSSKVYFSLKYVFLISITLVTLQCTAYLNTFYNAEQAFLQANTEHMKIMRHYPDSILTTPSASISTNYERAIEKSLKVINDFQKNQKWKDDALFLIAKSYFYKRSMPKAILRFKELQQQHPNSPFIPETYVYLGKAYIEEGNLSKAEEVISYAIEKYPQLDKDQKLSMLLVEIAIRRQGNAQAISLLEEAYKTVKNEERRIDLVLRLSELYIQLKQYNKAIAILKNAPRKKELPEQSYRLDRALLNCFMQIDSLNAALKQTDLMLAKKLYISHFKEIELKKGIILGLLGRYDDAIAIFEKITAGVDSTTSISDTTGIVSEALYELALIYQKKKAAFDEANKYYNLAAQSSDTLIAIPASKRLSALDILKNLRSAPPDSAEDNNFKIAELFRFELDEPDSAYNQYIAMATGNTGDIVPKSICAAAFVMRENGKDTAKADSLFRVLIEKYPSTDYCKIAQQQLNLPVTYKTREDSALDAFKAAEVLLYEKGEIKAATQAFFNVYKTYSDLPIAPKSLYVAGWLSDDYLQKNKTAKQLYERVCDRFPNSVYCTDYAKPRLKVVMDTLQALAGKKGGNEVSRTQSETDASSSDSTANLNDSMEESSEIDDKGNELDSSSTEPKTRRNYAKYPPADPSAN